jgi:hypothetical protein
VAAESTQSATPAKQVVYLDRRVAFIEPGRVNVRPALAAALLPLFWLLLGIGCFIAIILFLGTLPFWLVAVMLVVAVVSIPLAGIGLVYTIGGANVVFDREKGSGVWQQGFLGMGVGTVELVPFHKIAEIRIEETTGDAKWRRRGLMGDAVQDQRQDVAQFEIVLVKVSGKRLKIADTVMARSMMREGLADARTVAGAIASMTDKPLVAPEIVRRRKLDADGEDGE